MADDNLVFQVNIPLRQSTKFRDTHPCVEKDIDCFIILIINIVVMHKFQKFSHLVFCNGLPRHAVVHYHRSHHKSERVSHKQSSSIAIWKARRRTLLAVLIVLYLLLSYWSFIRNSFASNVLTREIFLSLKGSPLKIFFRKL